MPEKNPLDHQIYLSNTIRLSGMWISFSYFKDWASQLSRLVP